MSRDEARQTLLALLREVYYTTLAVLLVQAEIEMEREA
jgi:hypothetical protein